MTPHDDELVLISGGAHPKLAAALAAELQLELAPTEVGSFVDGETHVRVPRAVQGADVFIMQPTCPPVNDNLMALAQLVDAARAAGASRVTGLVPYFGYARQDRRTQVGDARSAQVAARWLAAVGLDHLVVLDLHTPALESAFSMPVTMLPPEALLLAAIKRWGLPDLAVVSPDAGGLKRAQRIAAALDAGLATVAKERPSPDMATPMRVLGNVKDCHCVLVDDMSSTSRTLIGAAEALRRLGAREVHAAFTHAVMGGEAWKRLLAAPLGRILTTDSVPFAADPRVEVVSIAPLFAQTVRDLHGGLAATRMPTFAGSTS